MMGGVGGFLLGEGDCSPLALSRLTFNTYFEKGFKVYGLGFRDHGIANG